MSTACEFCGDVATVYGGYARAHDWAGFSCDECATSSVGFAVWDRVATDESEGAA
jgi:hypothetical protein